MTDSTLADRPKVYEDPSRPRAERIAALGYDYSSREREPITACNLCGSDLWTILTHHDRYGFPAQATACGRCGLTVLNPRMTPASYSHFYESVYRPLVSAYYGRRLNAQTVQKEQKIYAVEMDRFLAPFLERRYGEAFLDVGGSTGIVAAHLGRRFGVKATVLDPAPAEIKEARELGVQTITSFIEDWKPGGGRFPIVGMFQTIDHLLDVAATLKKLRSVVTEDGIFIVDIVDFRAAYLKNWSVEAAVKIDHPFSLTEETAEAFLARAGFEPMRKAYSADYHLVAYVCRPCAPEPEAMPSRESVNQFFREVRFVQNIAGTVRGAA